MKDFLFSNLISPTTGEKLVLKDSFFVDSKNNVFPIIEDTPILINNKKSLFKIEDYNEKRFPEKTNKNISSIFKLKLLSFLNFTKPRITLNPISKKNYQKVALHLKQRNKPKVLIVGAGEGDGQGFESEDLNLIANITKTDIVNSIYVDVVCDAHSLPFKSGIFDAVVIQAVLEHVIDPKTCVNEIHRVLKKDGLVYAETPFMQQVHLGRYDFTRFTHLGHRRLFNNFREISSGPVCGPASALNWSIKYFFRTFFKASFAQFFFEWISTFFYFWLKYFDYFLIKKQGAYDSASGYFFYGIKEEGLISDREIIKNYEGLIDA